MIIEASSCSRRQFSDRHRKQRDLDRLYKQHLAFARWSVFTYAYNPPFGKQEITLILIHTHSDMMKSTLIVTPLLFMLYNAQNNPRSINLSDVLDVPPELEGLISSVESQASSAVGEIKSALSKAATAIPPEVLSKASEMWPAETSPVPSSGATSNIGAHLVVANAVVGAFAGWYVVN